VTTPYRPSTRHAALGEKFFDPVAPASFPQHILRYRNQPWAARVGLAHLTDEAWLNHFGKFQPLPGSFETPLALRYHGHQFRVYNPDLGDGRGFLFAQLHDLQDGRLLDLGTKGSGTTPWSRAGDGRLTLKGGVREILATAMLEALGVNTSKTFSLIETGESLYRTDEPSPTRAAVLVRLSHTHLRIGTFQRFAYLQDPDAIQTLLDHSIRVALPEAWREDPADRAVAFLTGVVDRVARLGAQWMAAGFVHGVLNTDNINITGESFDYGPWRFLPTYDPSFTAAYFDHSGLYAYGRQPETLLWNLVRLAECLLPLAPLQALQDAVNLFPEAFRQALPRQALWRLGLTPKSPEADADLAARLWTFLQATQAPFEQAFYDFHAFKARPHRLSSPHYQGEAYQAFRDALSAYEISPEATPHHAYFQSGAPCTMLIDEVERIWTPIAESDDWSLFTAKLASIARMGKAYGTAQE
jgi:uncharacterized protein YdiU (UPF0061 family)